MSIDKMRKNYTLGGLTEKDVDLDPMVQFQKWFDQTQCDDNPDWFEANAMTVSTAGLDGEVTSRILLLKGMTDSGFVFYTNYDSVKGTQIAANPQVSLSFFWPHLQRQVLVQGTAAKTSREQSSDYFHSRPRDSQLGAIASQQSEPTTRETLEGSMNQLQSQYAEGKIPCPDHWGGYEVTPSQFEFWQGRASRLHDRIVYRRSGDAWKIVRIAP